MLSRKSVNSFISLFTPEERKPGTAVIILRMHLLQMNIPVYYEALFHADVKRLLPGTTEDELNEIDLKTDDPYYQALQKLCDANSTLYEAYLQYPLKGRAAASYFAFVFGRIHGKYKVIAYYAQWPVKDR